MCGDKVNRDSTFKTPYSPAQLDVCCGPKETTCKSFPYTKIYLRRRPIPQSLYESRPYTTRPAYSGTPTSTGKEIDQEFIVWHTNQVCAYGQKNHRVSHIRIDLLHGPHTEPIYLIDHLTRHKSKHPKKPIRLLQASKAYLLLLHSKSTLIHLLRSACSSLTASPPFSAYPAPIASPQAHSYFITNSLTTRLKHHSPHHLSSIKLPKVVQCQRETAWHTLKSPTLLPIEYPGSFLCLLRNQLRALKHMLAPPCEQAQSLAYSTPLAPIARAA